MQLDLPSVDAPRIVELLEASSAAAGRVSRALQTADFGMTVPRVEQLATLLDVAFFASMQHEEGHPVRATIGFTPDGAGAVPASCARLATPIPFEPSSFAKISPCCEPGVSIVLVRPVEARGGSDLEIWGVCPLPASSPWYALSQELLCLHVRISGHGAVELRVLNEPVFSYVRGHRILHDETPLRMIELQKSFDGFRPARRGGDLLDSGDIVPIARAMRAHQRGGALIIVPDEGLVSGWEIKYRFSRRSALSARLERPRPAVQGAAVADSEEMHRECLSKSDVAYGNSLDAVVKTLGRLTAVDGAVVMTWEGRVLGFGAKVHVDAATIRDVEVSHVKPAERAPTVRKVGTVVGGMRHFSAIQACNSLGPGTAAVVASQDGDLSLIGWRNDRLQIVRPIGAF